MLPPDGPLLESALALLALPFHPVTVGVSPDSAGLPPDPWSEVRSSTSASCQAHALTADQPKLGQQDALVIKLFFPIFDTLKINETASVFSVYIF